MQQQRISSLRLSASALRLGENAILARYGWLNVMRDSCSRSVAFPAVVCGSCIIRLATWKSEVQCKNGESVALPVAMAFSTV